MRRLPSIVNNVVFQLSLLAIILVFNGLMGFAQPLSGILPKYNAYVHEPAVEFQWNSMEGAIDYTVVVANDAAFTQNIVQSPPQSGNTWTSAPVGYGLWYWKVVGFDGVNYTESAINRFVRFDPSQNANLSFWLKADAGITLDAGNKVESWIDQSPNAYILNQSNGPKRPIVNPSAYNSLPSVSFQGGQVLNGGDILDLGTNSRAMFVIGRMNGNDQALFAKSRAMNISNRIALIRDGTQTAFIYQEIAEKHIYSATNSNNFGLYQVSVFRNLSQNNSRLNNLNLGTNSITSSHNHSSNYRFLVGAYNNQNDDGELLFLNGDISEIVFVDTDNSGQIDQVQQYLKHKYNPPLDLGQDLVLNSFCNSVVSSNSGFTNLLWSTGETSPIISVSQSGTYWVRGTDPFGFVWQDTVQVLFPQIPQPINTGICLNQTNTWNADLGPGFTYLWSTGETTPSINIITPGTYNVTVYDGFGCSKNSGDFTFTIDNYETTAFLGNDTTLCSGNLIALQVGAGETEEYYWNGVSTGAQPSFWAVDTTGNYFLESVNVNGCVARDTIFVDIIGEAPVAGFSVSNVCDQSAAVFTDTSSTPDLSPVDEWLWTFGDGQQSTEQNPQHIFSSGPGTYNVQLYVAQGGCGAFFNAPIEVFQLPQANFSMSGFCDAEASAFVDQSIEGSGGITGWLWNFGQPSSGLANVSVQQNPSKSYGETGNFTVTLEVTDANNCTDQEVQTITINKSPLSEFTASDICAGDNITFSNSSSIPSPDFIQSYLWDFGDNTYSILPVPGKTYTSPGYRTISLNVTAGNGCSTTSQQQILVHAIPVPGILVGPSCVGTYTSLTDVSQVLTGVVASSSWEIDLNTTLTGSPAAYVFTTAGSHNIELTTTSDFGCTNDTMIVINVSPELNADFEVFPSVVIVGEPVEFQNNSVGAINYSWELGDGTLSSNFEPINTYGPQWIDSTLTAILYVTNSYGCTDTSSVDFSVNKARFDLEVRKLFVSEQNGFYNVGVELKNVGTALIEYTDVELRLSNGTAILERFEDTLLSGQTKIKVFTSKPSAYLSTQDEVDAWICADGTPYSALNLPDEDLSNNRYCRNAEGEEPVLIGPNPNPASTEFEFSVLVSKESVLTVDLIDARGRIVKSYFDATTVTPGLYTYTVSLLGVNSGVYLLRMNGEVKRMVVE